MARLPSISFFGLPSMKIQSQQIAIRRFVPLADLFRRLTAEWASEGNESEYARIAFVALAAVVCWFKLWQPVARFDLLGVICAAVGGYPIFKAAALDLRARRMTMELSMTIALVAALTINEVFTALVILFFVLVAEVLEEKTVARGRDALRSLTDQFPEVAEVVSETAICFRNLNDITAGERVIIRPGSCIPVDGQVVSGNSFVDQSAITGESLPVEKLAGEEVFAGTMNQSGILQVRVTKVGTETAFGKIVEAVERAEKSRAPVQKLADQLAGYLVYVALGAAFITFIASRDARATISVIIVAGACGVAAGTPLAILGAIGQAAKRGVIVKGGLYLERLSSVDTVVLDKTGTLTYGDTEVIAVVPAAGVSEEQLLTVAASAERYSEHPLGKAIVRRATAQALPSLLTEDFRYLPGKGIHCWVAGLPTLVGSRDFLVRLGIDVAGAALPSGAEVLVAQGSRLLGRIQISDSVRRSAAPAVRTLQKMNLLVFLMTGDSVPIAQAVAAALGVNHFLAGLLPEGKLANVRQLQSAGHKVAMVGDGINDAPALVEAHVGVAMGCGTDIARESGGIILLGNDLTQFSEVLAIARRCRRVILTNFVGTLAVDLVGIVLAMFGVLNPIGAALIHVCSESAFILNSARLLPGSAWRQRIE